MTPKKRLLKRLNKQLSLNIDLDVTISSHKSMGVFQDSWSWWIDDTNSYFYGYGSTFTITELLKYKTYKIVDGNEIVPI